MQIIFACRLFDSLNPVHWGLIKAGGRIGDDDSNDIPPTVTWNARNLLTVPEVAEWARVHPKTVYRWIREGRLEAIQFGPRTFRVPEDAIGKLLNKYRSENVC